MDGVDRQHPTATVSFDGRPFAWAVLDDHGVNIRRHTMDNGTYDIFLRDGVYDRKTITEFFTTALKDGVTDIDAGQFLRVAPLPQMQDRAKMIVFDYIMSDAIIARNHPTFSLDEVKVVWFCKTLQNWKAILTTTLPYGMFFEVTYDGSNKIAYLDHYNKVLNVPISDEHFAAAQNAKA